MRLRTRRGTPAVPPTRVNPGRSTLLDLVLPLILKVPLVGIDLREDQIAYAHEEAAHG